MNSKNIFQYLRAKALEMFSLKSDAATQEDVYGNIRRSIEMKGTNLWVLIFAIIMASLGLNTNSTAVIIGAMLISPLMGPIIGMGYSMGVYDFALLKSSFRNFLTMVVVSLVASSIFFMLPLISVDQSELLARTQPTTYDILIALFGGLAGMVAQTRKDRTGTVIPGVAIATALMPPLCTVGYGLATIQPRYILGALYLFTINSLFIALAAYFITRFLHYRPVGDLDQEKKKKLKRGMFAVIFVVTVPSVIIAVSIIQRSSFESNVDWFVKQAFNFEQTVVVETQKHYQAGRKPSTIEIRLFGEPLSDDIIENLQQQLSSVYHLNNTELVVRQSKDVGKMNITALQSSYADIIKEKNLLISNLQQQLSQVQRIDTLAASGMARELGVFLPTLQSMSLSKHIQYNQQGQAIDTAYVCILSTDSLAPSRYNREVLQRWLSARTGNRRVEIIVK